MKRLLLVDENALFRDGLALLLEWKTGLGSVQAQSIAESRRILGRSHGEIALAVVNIDLPGGDGIELIEELRKADTEVSVLGLTAGRSLPRCASALRAGAEEVLTLGTPIETILDAIMRLAGGVEPE
jgi:DNA-binding NarL/FixJ family response regulator